MDYISAFSVKKKGQTISIVAHDLNGKQHELAFFGGDVVDLIGGLMIAETEFRLEEDLAYAAQEAEWDRLAEERLIGGHEARLEMDFSDKGYDNDFAPDGD